MAKYAITTESTKTVRRFNMEGRTVQFRINPVPENVEPIGWVKGAVEEIVTRTTSHLQPQDKVGITFCSSAFERGPGYIPFKNAAQLTMDDVWSTISSIHQSNSTGLDTDTFCLNVTSVRMPAGMGPDRRRTNFYNTFEEECAKRRGIVVIANKDNLCLPRALVVAKAYADSASTKEIRNVRQNKAKAQDIATQNLLLQSGKFLISFIL